ncbi:hypothetical protein [Trichocoleus sp. FACHB-832]|uniref:hypothetical protein n=1 Tax=Trichocoleus sp. FACHB-832 TaxID=2692875 RepID=UPI001688A721|nr:hypothetical protein [Trichocoleus sp. FACHB-832]
MANPYTQSCWELGDRVSQLAPKGIKPRLVTSLNKKESGAVDLQPPKCQKLI